MPKCAEDIKFVIAGKGTQRAKIEKVIREKRLDRSVILLGHLDKQRLARLYYAADIFVLPSIVELFGIVAHEAMLAGLPAIVSSGVGGARDLIIPGKTGFVFDRNKPEQAWRTIEYLSRDRQRVQKMGNQARELAKRWNHGYFASCYASALKTIQDQQSI